MLIDGLSSGLSRPTPTPATEEDDGLIRETDVPEITHYQKKKKKKKKTGHMYCSESGVNTIGGSR